MTVQWGLEYQTCLDFGWLKAVWLVNGLVFKKNSKTKNQNGWSSKYTVLVDQPFEIQTILIPIFKMFGFRTDLDFGYLVFEPPLYVL